MSNNDSGIIECNSTLTQLILRNHPMRNVSIRIGNYDVSIILIVALGALLGTVVAATYMWTTEKEKSLLSKV